jgi:hypothetical protein
MLESYKRLRLRLISEIKRFRVVPEISPPILYKMKNLWFSQVCQPKSTALADH